MLDSGGLVSGRLHQYGGVQYGAMVAHTLALLMHGHPFLSHATHA
jgi:hypothetical protein